MKDIIINAVNIDLFLTYNNGNLVNTFMNKHLIKDVNDYDIKKYKSKILINFRNKDT